MAKQVEPVIVCGGQGSGKTTLLREMHAKYSGPSIYLTTKKNERTAANNPPMRIRKSSCSYPKDIKDAREWAQQYDDTVQVIIDECQNAPTFIDGDGPTRKMLHEDREAGVKTVIATQSPDDLRTNKRNYAPVQQCDVWIWVGPLKSWHVGFIQANGLSDMTDHMPQEKYEYVAFEPIESKTPEDRILDIGTTNTNYT